MLTASTLLRFVRAKLPVFVIGTASSKRPMIGLLDLLNFDAFNTKWQIQKWPTKFIKRLLRHKAPTSLPFFNGKRAFYLSHTRLSIFSYSASAIVAYDRLT